MKRLLCVAAGLGLALVSAAPPDTDSLAQPTDTSGGYPPCSRTVKDRCIQLYERGVKSPDNLALNERLGPGRIGAAMGGPVEPAPPPSAGAEGTAATAAPATDYPACSAEVQDRCIQLYERGVRRSQ